MEQMFKCMRGYGNAHGFFFFFFLERNCYQLLLFRLGVSKLFCRWRKYTDIFSPRAFKEREREREKKEHVPC